MKSFNGCEKIFLNILRCALAGERYEGAHSGEEWREIFTLAELQTLLPVIFESVCESAGAREFPELFKVVKGRVISSVVRQFNRNLDFHELYLKMLAAGARPLVVKGQLCAALYPLPDHRISSDDDIFAAPGEYDICRNVLEWEGLTAEHDDDGSSHETAYGLNTENGKCLRIELHRTLFAADAPDDFNRFFTDAFKSCVKIGDHWSLLPHEHLLYLLAHSFKHFTIVGVGVRQTCDIGLWARAHFDEIDWARLKTELSAIRAFRFAAAQFRLLEDHLGFSFDFPDFWRDEIRMVELEPMIADMFDGGAYGNATLTRVHSSTAVQSAVHADRKGREKGNFLRTLFPSYSYIAGRFSYVKRFPILLPIGWAERLIRYALELKNTDSSASGSLQVARERVELLKYYDVID